MKIFLHEIKDHDTDLQFSQDDAWLTEAVYRVDERSKNQDPFFKIPGKRKKRQISAHLTLRQVDEVVVVSGKITTFVELLCSRCANVFQFPCAPKFAALFCKDPVLAGVGHLQKADSHFERGESPVAKPAGKNKGHARHAHLEEEAGSSMQDLDITYLSEDFIDLGDVVTEQLQLQVPFLPLCVEDCKGMCSQCGTDLNAGRCACAKLQKESPFSVLKDFKF